MRDDVPLVQRGAGGESGVKPETKNLFLSPFPCSSRLPFLFSVPLFLNVPS